MIFDTSTSLVLQQLLSGTGVFDGTEVGRAALTLGAGNAAVIFRSRQLGADFNVYVVKMMDPGRDTPGIVVTWDPNYNILNVVVKRTAGVISSTAAQIAAAVQAKGFVVTADYGGTGADVVVPASGTLSGGLNPTIYRNVQYKFAPAAHVNGGRFSFDQAGNLLIRQFEAKLSASVAWTLELINLDEGLREITADTVLFQGSTSQNIIIPNMNLVLSPLRALKFSAAAQGVARVVAHKEPNFPFA